MKENIEKYFTSHPCGGGDGEETICWNCIECGAEVYPCRFKVHIEKHRLFDKLDKEDFREMADVLYDILLAVKGEVEIIDIKAPTHAGGITYSPMHVLIWNSRSDRGVKEAKECEKDYEGRPIWEKLNFTGRPYNQI